jgi:histidinol-phosphate/aromatic aminotransferase/cobyric acid decarboxylase-like protein
MAALPPYDPRSRYVKPEVQIFHGGQGYRECPNFKCDFSVETNNSGPPKSAVSAALQAFNDLEHYPEQDAWVPRCHLALYFDLHPSQILVGNGSSELIDVFFRIFPAGTTWRPGPWQTQYREYHRCASLAGLCVVPPTDITANITVLVNPNSPTGEYLTLSHLRDLLSQSENSIFVIDESYLMFYGPQWASVSATQLIREFPDRVAVITSWSKCFACPSLRLGTLMSSTSIIARVAALQPPWTVNGFAQEFFVAALKESDYFDEMWATLPKYRAEMIALFKEVGFHPKEDSPDWVPFICVDLITEEIAKKAFFVAHNAGFPVRSCQSFGLPTVIRCTVRPPTVVKQLIAALTGNEELVAMIRAAQQSPHH